MNALLVVGVGILALIVFILLSFPITVAGAMAGIMALLIIGKSEQLAGFAILIPWSEIAVYSFTVVPLFILMGDVMARSQMVGDLFDVSWKWVGKMPGGPGLSTVAAGAMLGAACGSTVAAATILTKLTVPMMREHGFPDSFSTGLVAAAANLSALIPPSTLMVLYGVMTQTSISKLLIAGLLPGLVLGGTLSVGVFYQARRDPKVRVSTVSVSWGERFRSLAKLWQIALVILVIMGGLYSGFATPTEVAALGTLIVIVISLIKRKFNGRDFMQGVRDTVIATSRIFIIVIGVVLLGRAIVISGGSNLIASTIGGLPVPAPVTFLLVVAVYFILGMFMDGVSILIITLPVFLPLIKTLGYDPIWFGVIVVIMIGVGFITPPVGLNVFAIRGIMPDIKTDTIFSGVWPFVIASAVVVGILMAFPQIALYLPRMMNQ